MSQLLDRIHLQIQSAEGDLRHNQSHHLFAFKLCNLCGWKMPPGTKKCHPCQNSNFSLSFCTNEHRVAELFKVLCSVRLWPSVTQFQVCSASELSNRMALAPEHSTHTCDAGSDCPLRLKLFKLKQDVCNMISEVEGIPLNFS